MNKKEEIKYWEEALTERELEAISNGWRYNPAPIAFLLLEERKKIKQLENELSYYKEAAFQIYKTFRRPLMDYLNKRTKAELIDNIEKNFEREMTHLKKQSRIILRTNEGNVGMQIAECSDERMAQVIGECLIDYYTKNYNEEGKIQAEQITVVTGGFENDRKTLMEYTFPWYVETGEY